MNLTKMWLLENAINGIRDGKSSIPCQLVLNNILRLWPVQEGHHISMDMKSMSVPGDSTGKYDKTDEKQRKKEEPNTDSHIDITSLKSRFQLVKKYDLVSLAVHDLCRYVKQVKNTVKEEQEQEQCLEELGGQVISGRYYSHVVSVSSRLEFLKFIMGLCFNAAMEEHNVQLASGINVNIPGSKNKVSLTIDKESDNLSESLTSSDQKAGTETLPILRLSKRREPTGNPTNLVLDKKKSDLNKEIVRIVATTDEPEIIPKPNTEIPRDTPKSRNRSHPPIHHACTSSDPIVIEDDDDVIDTTGPSANIEPNELKVNTHTPHKRNQSISLESSVSNENFPPSSLNKTSHTGFNRKGIENSHNQTLNTTTPQASSPLTSDHIELLWSNLVENSLTSQESGLCLSALHSILLTSECCVSIRMHLAPILFHYCLNRLPVTPMRSPAFDLFSLSMTCCNLIQGKYELFIAPSNNTKKNDLAASNTLLGHHNSSAATLAPDSNIHLRLASFDVLGIDKLWEISLYAHDEEVAKKAMSSLSTLYTFQSIVDKLKDDVPTQQRRFVQSCMSALKGNRNINLKQHSPNYSNLEDKGEQNDDKTNSTIRCLRLVSTFADAIMRHAIQTGVIPKPSSSEGSNISLPSISHGHATSAQSKKLISGVSNHFHVRVQPAYGLSSFEVKCRPGATIAYLRQIVRERASGSSKATPEKSLNIDGVSGKRSSMISTYSDQKSDFSQLNSKNNVTNRSKAELKSNADYRLIYQGKELSKENMLLTSCGITDGTVVHWWPRIHTKSVLEKTLAESEKNIIDIDDNTRHIEKRKRQFTDNLASSYQKKLTDNRKHDKHYLHKNSKTVRVSDILLLPPMAAIAELVKPQHISDFFLLLCEKISKEQRQIRDLVWDLLQLLPTDPKMTLELSFLTTYSKTNKAFDERIDKIISFHVGDCCEWEILLPPLVDPESSFRLLYSLQIVESLAGESAEENTTTSAKKARIAPDTKDDIVRNQTSPNQRLNNLSVDRGTGKKPTWNLEFSSRGGVAHLINILLNIDTSPNGRYNVNQLDHAKNHIDSLDDFLFSSNLLFILRCTHRLQQLLIFFLEESSEGRSTLIAVITEQSGFGRLLSHTLEMLHWSVCIQVSC